MKSATFTCALAVASVALATAALAQPGSRGPNRRPQPTPTPTPTAVLKEFRSIDGSGNNRANPSWGKAETPEFRMVPADYADGVSEPSGSDRPSARAVSNAVCLQTDSEPNAAGVSDMVWQWGQFIDHDLSLTLSAVPAEPFNIVVPTGDPYFDPASTGTQVITLSRAHYEVVDGVRQQVNELTSYIDASMVYGSDAETAAALRTLDGTGRLKTSEGDLLPVGADGVFFAAGDIRVNEQIGLTAMHTLWVREHNFWADLIRARSLSSAVSSAATSDAGRSDAARGGRTPSKANDEFAGLPTIQGEVTDEAIYQLARAIVAAEIQAITYREFLPTLLGPDALAPYRGYRPNVNATVANEFATTAYRVGHTMLSPELQRLDANLNSIAEGPVALADAFFDPDSVRTTGIDPILRGLARQRAQELDAQIVDDVRNFLFGPPGAGGFDLPSLNIQRGRDHGIPALNALRVGLGLGAHADFASLSTEPGVAAKFASVYATIDQVDPWVGMLAEDDVPGALVGPTLFTIITEQFEASRDGDRFWYEVYLPKATQQMVEAQTLAQVIRRNTAIRSELQDDVFRVPVTTPPPPDAPRPTPTPAPPAQGPGGGGRRR